MTSRNHVVAGILAVLVMACGATANAVSPIEQTERGATVETDRYRAEIENGVLVSFFNKLTREEYLDSQADLGGVLPHLPSGLGTRATKAQFDGARRLYVMPWWELPQDLDLPNQHYPSGSSHFTFTARDDNGCVLSYTGLTDGTASYAKDVYTLDVGIDDATGDLLLTPSARTKAAGVYAVNLTVKTLDPSVTIEAPIFDGVRITHEMKPQLWINEWGNYWDYAFLALNGRKTGAVGVWCQDAELKYYKHLFYLINDEGISFSLSTMNVPPFEKLTEAEGMTWRFQAFDKSWSQAVARFRAWRQANVKIAPRPDWTREISMVNLGVNGAMRWLKILEAYIGTENLGRAITFGPTIRAAAFDTRHYDNTPHAGFKENMADWEAAGGRLMAYLQPMIMWGAPPWEEEFKPIYDLHMAADTLNPFQLDSTKPKKYTDQHHLGHAGWQGWFLKCVYDYINVYGADGVYHDQSYICPIDNRGLVNGMTSTAGMADYFYKAATQSPNSIHGTEHLTEINSVGASLGIASGAHWGTPKSMRMQRLRHASPVDNALHYPNAAMFAYPHFTDFVGSDAIPFHIGMSLSERRGEIPGQNLQTGQHFPRGVPFDQWVNEYKLNRTRSLTFLARGLRAVFPEDWDRRVLTYFRGAKGEEFRYESMPWGTRFVRMEGAEARLVYGRIHGVSATNVDRVPENEGLQNVFIGDLTAKETAPVLEGGISGWVAYDPEGPCGLNPDNYYVLDPAVKRPPVVFSGIPSSLYVEDGYVNDTFALLRIKPESSVPSFLYVVNVILNSPTPPLKVWVNGVPARANPAGEGKYSITARNLSSICVLLKDPPAGLESLPATAGCRAVSEINTDNFDSTWLTARLAVSKTTLDGAEAMTLSGPAHGHVKQLHLALAPPADAKQGRFRVHVRGNVPLAEFAVNGAPRDIGKDGSLDVAMKAGESAVLSFTSRSPVQASLQWVEAAAEGN